MCVSGGVCMSSVSGGVCMSSVSGGVCMSSVSGGVCMTVCVCEHTFAMQCHIVDHVTYFTHEELKI